MGLTFEQVRQAERNAYWEDVEKHHVLRNNPHDTSLWIMACDRPFPSVGIYIRWQRFAADPPAEGWYDPEQPCGCGLCAPE